MWWLSKWPEVSHYHTIADVVLHDNGMIVNRSLKQPLAKEADVMRVAVMK